MADVLTQLRTLLTTSSVGHRVYPMMRPEGSDLPAVVYELVAEELLPTMTGTLSTRRARVQLNIIADRYQDLVSVGEELHELLQDWRSHPLDPVTVQGAFRELVTDVIDTPTDGSGELTHRRVAEYSIWHNRE